MDYQRRVCFVVLLLAYVVMVPGAWAQARPGLVVEQVAKNSEGEKAGLQQGDIVLRWSRGDAKDELESPFDLSEIEIEQEPRGTVRLAGLRGAKEIVWVLGPDNWGITAGPVLHEPLASLHRGGQESARAGEFSKAAERWQKAATQAQESESGRPDPRNHYCGWRWKAHKSEPDDVRRPVREFRNCQ